LGNTLCNKLDILYKALEMVDRTFRVLGEMEKDWKVYLPPTISGFKDYLNLVFN